MRQGASLGAGPFGLFIRSQVGLTTAIYLITLLFLYLVRDVATLPPATPVIWSPALLPSKLFCCQSLANWRIQRTTTWRSIATPRKRCTRRNRSKSPPDDFPPQRRTLSSTPARSSQTMNPAKRPTPGTSHNGPSFQIYSKYDNVTRLTVGN